jgi:hypothetical protein
MGTTLSSFIAAHPDEAVNGTIRVCIGGGSGFIGSHIAKRLKEAVRYAMYIQSLNLIPNSFILGMLCCVC